MARRGVRREKQERRARFDPRRFCWRCGVPLQGRNGGQRRCPRCQSKMHAEHELWLEARMTGKRREIDFSRAPIAAAYAGWRRTPRLRGFARRFGFAANRG